MQRADVEVLLETAEAARRRTRSRLRQFWLPLVLFGGLTLASAVVAALAPGPTVGLFWSVGGPAGTLATALWYWRRHEALGVSILWWPSAVVGLGLLVVSEGLGWWGRGGPLTYAGVLLIVEMAYAAFSCFERSLPLAAFAAASVVAAIVLAVALPAHAYELASGLLGATAVVLGLLLAARS